MWLRQKSFCNKNSTWACPDYTVRSLQGNCWYLVTSVFFFIIVIIVGAHSVMALVPWQQHNTLCVAEVIFFTSFLSCIIRSLRRFCCFIQVHHVFGVQWSSSRLPALRREMVQRELEETLCRLLRFWCRSLMMVVLNSGTSAKPTSGCSLLFLGFISSYHIHLKSISPDCIKH